MPGPSSIDNEPQETIDSDGAETYDAELEEALNGLTDNLTQVFSLVVDDSSILIEYHQDGARRIRRFDMNEFRFDTTPEAVTDAPRLHVEVGLFLALTERHLALSKLDFERWSAQVTQTAVLAKRIKDTDGGREAYARTLPMYERHRQRIIALQAGVTALSTALTSANQRMRLSTNFSSGF